MTENLERLLETLEDFPQHLEELEYRLHERAASKGSFSALATKVLAQSAYMRGDSEKAKFYFERCIERCPEEPDAYFLLGNQFLEEGREQEGITLLEKGLTYEDTPYIRYELADAYYSQGDLASAIGHLEAILTSDEGVDVGLKASAYHLAGGIYEIFEAPDAALSKFLEGYEQTGNEKFLVEAAWTHLFQLENEGMARMLLSRVYRAGDDRPEVTYPLGLLALRDEEYDTSRQLLTEAYLNTRRPSLRAEILMMQSEVERELVEISEEEDYSMVMPRLRKAHRHLEEAAELGLSNPDFHLRLSYLEDYVTGNKEQARYHLMTGLTQESIGQEAYKDSYEDADLELERNLWKSLYHFM